MSMKKLSYLAALVVAMTAVSCVQDINEGAPVSDNGATVFTATFDATAAAKAVLEPGAEESKVLWEAGDQVSVLAGEANYLYSAKTAGATTTLATQATDVPAEGTFYAVYPYNADAAVVPATEAETPDSISTVLPAQQTAVKGSFATHLAVAKAADNKFAFKNVCALVKVNIAADGVTKIVFEGNDSEVVACGINVAVADVPAWKAVKEQGATSVTLASASALEAGDYFFAVLPQTFAKGFKVTAYKGEQSWVVRNVTASTTLERAGIVGGKSFFEIEGNGTEANPYILKTPEHLVGMRSLATLKGETWFKMANDIDMKDVTNYVPVNFDQNFERKIHFDGGNFTISNFTSSHAGYPSLFGVLYGSCKNLKVTNAAINSTGHVTGILGGYIGTTGKAAQVTNVHVKGTVTSSTGRCGGFAGNVVDATFTDCTADVIVNGTQDVGGFVGKIQGLSIFENCEVKSVISASISSKNRAGSFAGYACGSTATFKECKVLTGSKITDATSNTAAYLGMYSGFLAYSGSTTKTLIENCSVDVEIELPWAQSVSGLVAILGAKELEVKGSKVSGKIKGNNQVAGVLAHSESATNITVSNTEVSASITGGTTTSSHYCAGLIGNLASATTTTITGCSVSGEVKSSGSSNAGLVGAVTAGTISIADSYATGSVSGNNNIGGLVGNFGVEGSMTDCYYKGAKVTATAPGGLIGSTAKVKTLTDCYAETSLEGKGGNTGGLVASVSSGPVAVTKCHFTGNITSTEGNVGGLLGRSTAGVAIISKSYSTGAINMNVNKNNVGGLIGYGQDFQLSDSWSSMNVTSGGQAIGGLVGMCAAVSTISNCYYTGNVKGRASTGGIMGMSYNNKDGNVLEKCVVWGSVENTKTNATQYAGGVIIGCVNKNTITAKNCWRSADISFKDYTGVYDASKAGEDFIYQNPLVDHDDVITSLPPYLSCLPNTNVTNAFAQRPYHGKAAAADATVSSVAQSLGWSADIWDFSGAFPTLK